ncbi:hypothetical protein J6590_039205 [Homalodisca vitripennis]|nr:hypothetical protein J6590_039205 [Homalodisca vitripennis]
MAGCPDQERLEMILVNREGREASVTSDLYWENNKTFLEGRMQKTAFFRDSRYTDVSKSLAATPSRGTTLAAWYALREERGRDELTEADCPSTRRPVGRSNQSTLTHYLC